MGTEEFLGTDKLFFTNQSVMLKYLQLTHFSCFFFFLKPTLVSLLRKPASQH